MSEVIVQRKLAPFIIMQLSSVASVISGSMTFIAIPWIALEITGSATSAGLVVASTAIPTLLLAPFLGSFIDKFGRQKTAVGAEIIAGFVALLIPIVSGLWQLTIPALIAIGIMKAAVTPGGSTARKSLIPDVAKPAGMTLDRANSIHEGLFASGFAVGPALATFLIASIGSANTFFVIAGFAILSGLFAIFIRAQEQHDEEKEDEGNLFVFAMQGFKVLFSNPAIFIMMAAIMALAVIYLPTEMVVLPAYYNALEDPEGLGAAISAAAFASVFGALGFEWIHKRLSYANILRVGILGIGLSMLPMSTLPDQWAMVTFFFTLGLAWGPLLPLLNTVIQERIPADKRGRVFALEMTVWNAGPLISMVAVGAAVDAYGVGAVYTVLAVGVLIAGVFVSFNKYIKELDV
ncbi:MAG: MFS transporter [Actinobacteria bacterium]|nr:MFS transporter [Actinomycetota bacterium]